MAELLTIARPYAEAAFGLAKDQPEQAASLKAWSEALSRLAAVVQSPDAARLLSDPKVSAADSARLVSEVSGGLNQGQQGFVRVMAENGRLSVLPEVLLHFESLRNEYEKVCAAEVRSALPMTDAQLSDVVNLLSKKFGRPIKAHVVVDPSLIGGVSVAIGDEVIDASVSGKLSKMASALMN
jgi:F-type H+-transporting ATPase subunit delta